jgi:hypothetical protein
MRYVIESWLFSVDATGLKPNCSVARMLLACKNKSYIILSNTLENEVDKEIGI